MQVYNKQICIFRSSDLVIKDKFIYIAKPNILSSQRSTFNLKPFDNAIPHKFISCSFQCLGQGTLPQLFVQKLKLLDFVIIKTRYKTIVLWNFKRILFTSESYLAFFGVRGILEKGRRQVVAKMKSCTVCKGNLVFFPIPVQIIFHLNMDLQEIFNGLDAITVYSHSYWLAIF